MSRLFKNQDNEAIEEDKFASLAVKKYFNRFVNFNEKERKPLGMVSTALIDKMRDEVDRMKEKLTEKLTLLNDINSGQADKNILNPLNQVSNNGDVIRIYNSMVRIYKQKQLDTLARERLKSIMIEIIESLEEIKNEYITIIQSNAFPDDDQGNNISEDAQKTYLVSYLIRHITDLAIYSDILESIESSSPYFINNNSIKFQYNNVISNYFSDFQRDVISDTSSKKQEGRKIYIDRLEVEKEREFRQSYGEPDIDDDELIELDDADGDDERTIDLYTGKSEEASGEQLPEEIEAKEIKENPNIEQPQSGEPYFEPQTVGEEPTFPNPNEQNFQLEVDSLNNVFNNLKAIDIIYDNYINGTQKMASGKKKDKNKLKEIMNEINKYDIPPMRLLGELPENVGQQKKLKQHIENFKQDMAVYYITFGQSSKSDLGFMNNYVKPVLKVANFYRDKKNRNLRLSTVLGGLIDDYQSLIRPRGVNPIKFNGIGEGKKKLEGDGIKINKNVNDPVFIGLKKIIQEINNNYRTIVNKNTPSVQKDKTPIPGLETTGASSLTQEAKADLRLPNKTFESIEQKLNEIVDVINIFVNQIDLLYDDNQIEYAKNELKENLYELVGQNSEYWVSHYLTPLFFEIDKLRQELKETRIPDLENDKLLDIVNEFNPKKKNNPYKIIDVSFDKQKSVDEFKQNSETIKENIRILLLIINTINTVLNNDDALEEASSKIKNPLGNPIIEEQLQQQEEEEDEEELMRSENLLPKKRGMREQEQEAKDIGGAMNMFNNRFGMFLRNFERD